MEDTQLTQNNSPATGPLVAKTSDGLNLSVQTYGDVGNDEILFVHGFGQSRLSWSKQTSSSPTERYRVVTFDLRGHGNSGKPDHAAAGGKGNSPGNLHISSFPREELSGDLVLSCPINSHPNRSRSMRT